MTEVWFARHGETQWNQQRRIQGWTDVPLNQTGLLQAHETGRRLRDTQVNRILSSDLKRAVQTASIIAQYTGIPVTVDARLRERGLGPAEGSLRNAQDQFLKDLDGAEPRSVFQERIQSLLTELSHANPEGQIVCITHGGWIRSLLQLLGCTQHRSIGNASLTRLVYEREDWHVLGVGDSTHLQPVTGKP